MLTPYVVGIRMDKTFICIRIFENFLKGISREFHLLYPTQSAQCSHVQRGDTFRMQAQKLGVMMSKLMYESCKMKHFDVLLLQSKIVLHCIFILIPIASQDTERIIIVNHRAFCRHQTIVE